MLLTLSQLVLVNWINENLNQEVQKQATQLSKQVVKLAVNEMAFIHKETQTPIKRVVKRSVTNNSEHHDIQNVEIIAVPSSEEISGLLEKHADGNEYTIAVDHQGNEIDAEKIKRELNQLVEKIHGNRLIHTNSANKAVFEVYSDSSSGSDSNGSNQNTTNVAERHLLVETLPLGDNTQKLIQTIEIMITASAIIALAFAFWLSVKFSRPLKRLTTGFDAVAQGNYQISVEQSGVKEIRQTITQFNDMVAKVKTLTQAQLQNQDIENLAELGEVSRGLAHSLRNPIHTIGLSIEQMLEPTLKEKDRIKLITTIKNKIAHIDLNIKALLTLTTSGLSRNDDVPLLAVVQDIILEYKSCQGKQLTFEVNVAAEMKIKGAESEIRSIVHTLIINACQASPDNGRVEIMSETDHINGITLTVVDHGTGLSKDIEQQLFKPHVSTKPEGAGMGLYIAKRLVNLHYHGDVTLNNLVENNKVSGCKALVNFKVSNEQ